MSHENPDKQFHWRDRLEHLEYLPGKALNKETAWDKLHGRLRGDHRRKRIAWYWIAAACLVVVLMISLMNKTTNKPTVAKIQPVKQDQKINAPVLPIDEQKASENKIAAIVPKDKGVTVLPSTSVKGNHHVKAVEVTQAIAPTNSANPDLKSPMETLQINNNSVATQTLPAKKKLNVVHINELGDPVIEDPDLVRDLDKHKLKFGAGEVYANSSTGYETSRRNMLTAKL